MQHRMKASEFAYEGEGVGGLKTLEERAREQSKNLQEKYMNNQRKNAKLFEDDSEEGNASLIQEEEMKQNQGSPRSKDDNRSNLVKKLFYKESTASNSNLRQT